MAKELAELDEGTRLKALDDRIKKQRAVLDKIGFMVSQDSRKNFRRGGFGEKPWEPRSVPNVPGILSDLQAGSKPKERRWKPGTTLVDTGALRDSISYRVISDDTVEIGTSLDYASLHQFGGETTIQITNEMKRLLAEYFRGLSKQLRRERREIGWLFQRDSQTFQIPQRKFLGVTPQMRKKVNELVAKTIAEMG